MGRKPHKNRPSDLTLVWWLNQLGPKIAAKKLGVSKVTIHNWMNEIGIESKTKYHIKP